MGKAEKKKEKSEGVCALTLLRGQYVASHILPKALTKISATGERRFEVGAELRIKKRYDSWYDDELVIRKGEDILSEIDDQAIRALRSHKLIWSGWGKSRRLSEIVPDHEAYVLRSVKLDASMLQLFFLSLLWRSAASSRPEFREITMPGDVLEDLRLRLINRNPGPYNDYPVQLVQLTTLGDPHNRTPLLESYEIPIEGWANTKIPYVRFYFDGLIAKVHLPIAQALPGEYLKTCLGMGGDGQTLVVCIPYEESRTLHNLKEIVIASSRINLDRSSLSPIASAVETMTRKAD